MKAIQKDAESLYFIAIVPPEPVLCEILEFKNHMAKTYGAKAALRSPAHITLHMPFKWKETKEDFLIKSLIFFSSSQHSFELTLQGFGCFKPRVIFINSKENDLLNSLQLRLRTLAKKELNLFNSNYRSHPFHPHITIAFRDLKKELFIPAWEEFKSKIYQVSFMVNAICLLKHNGKRWDICHRIPFKENS